MKIKLPPEFITLGTKRYAIQADDRIFKEDENVGLCTGSLCLIRYAPSQSPQQIPDTVLHEALHALLYETSLSHFLETLGDKKDIEEAIVRPLATALLDFVRLNPQFVKWLQQSEYKPR